MSSLHAAPTPPCHPERARWLLPWLIALASILTTLYKVLTP